MRSRTGNVFETIRSFVGILANKEPERKGNALVNSGAPTEGNEFAVQKLRRYLDDVSPRSWKTIPLPLETNHPCARLETLLAIYKYEFGNANASIFTNPLAKMCRRWPTYGESSTETL